MLICQLAVLCSAWRSQLQISILSGRQITFIVECGTIFSHKCFLCSFFYLAGSDRAIFVYFIVNIFRFAGQFKISQIGSHIQVIQVIEYLFAFIAVLYFSSSSSSTLSSVNAFSSCHTAASAASSVTPGAGLPVIWNNPSSMLPDI